MRPREALQLQADLRHRLRTSQAWPSFADRMLASMEAQRTAAGGLLALGTGEANALTSVFLGRGVGEAWVHEQSVTLSRGLTHIVAEHMNPLIRMAAADYPRDLEFRPEMVPCPDGVLFFEKSWESTDVRGQQVKVRAITWSTGRNIGGRPGVHVSEFTDLEDPDEITRTLIHKGLFKAIRRDLGRLQLHHDFGIQYSRTLETVTQNFADPVLREIAVTGPAVILSLWHLMSQTLTSVTRAAMPPKIQKSYRKQKLLGEVNVITLRRTQLTPAAPGAGGDALYQRDFRWPVRGHWHGYWCGSGEDRRLVKRYVHPYLKGPEDAPIRISKQVLRLAR